MSIERIVFFEGGAAACPADGSGNISLTDILDILNAARDGGLSSHTTRQ